MLVYKVQGSGTILIFNYGSNIIWTMFYSIKDTEFLSYFLNCENVWIGLFFLSERSVGFVIFYTEILTGKVVLWCFFSSETS